MHSSLLSSRIAPQSHTQTLHCLCNAPLLMQSARPHFRRSPHHVRTCMRYVPYPLRRSASRHHRTLIPRASCWCRVRKSIPAWFCPHFLVLCRWALAWFLFLQALQATVPSRVHHHSVGTGHSSLLPASAPWSRVPRCPCGTAGPCRQELPLSWPVPR